MPIGKKACYFTSVLGDWLFAKALRVAPCLRANRTTAALHLSMSSIVDFLAFI